MLDEWNQFETAPVRRDFYQIVRIKDVAGIMSTTFHYPATRGSGSYLYLLVYLNSQGCCHRECCYGVAKRVGFRANQAMDIQGNGLIVREDCR